MLEVVKGIVMVQFGNYRDIVRKLGSDLWRKHNLLRSFEQNVSNISAIIISARASGLPNSDPVQQPVHLSCDPES